MAKQSQAWKALERMVAGLLKGHRVQRGGDFSVSDVDVEVDDFPYLRVDAKLRSRWAHHTYMKDIIKKYCVVEGQVPVLVTRQARHRGLFVVVPLTYFAWLLGIVRSLAARLRIGIPVYDAKRMNMEADVLEYPEEYEDEGGEI